MEDDENMSNKHMTLWNMMKINKKGEEGKKNVYTELEVPSNSSSSLSRSPVPGCTKNDVKVAYELDFVRSTYPRKAKEIRFPTQPVPCQSKLGVDSNR